MSKFVIYTDSNNRKKVKISGEWLKENEERKRKIEERKRKTEKETKNRLYLDKWIYKRNFKRQEKFIEKIRKSVPKERWNKYGDESIKRFVSKIYIGDENECWTWLGNIHYSGYGNFKINYKTVSSHRFIYTLINGEIQNLCVLHKCDNKACVNILHLFLGTHQDNTDDMIEKGRDNYIRNQNGEDNPNNILTWEVVNNIRKEYFESNTSMNSIGKKYGVSHGTIGLLINNKTWYDSNYNPCKGRNIRSEKCHFSKLTWSNIDEIREKYKKGNISTRKLAKEYKTNHGTISLILNNKIWYDEQYHK